jgi:hypothetical protein
MDMNFRATANEKTEGDATAPAAPPPISNVIK